MTSILEVSGQRLRANVRGIDHTLAEAVAPSDGRPHPALLAVIKANGYGHGATICAPILARAGVPWLGVTDAWEGAAVRESVNRIELDGPPPSILVMSGPPGDAAGARVAAEEVVRHALTPVVWNAEQLAPLAAASAGDQPVHLEIDTGMSRQGVPPGEALQRLLEALGRQPGLRLDGVFTHFATAEAADARQTTRQMELFEAAVAAIFSSGGKPGWLHVGNSSTIDNAAPAAASMISRLHALAGATGARVMVRCGLGLYGICLPLAPDAPASERLRPRLYPVLTWRTTITSILEIPEGASVGYSATFTADRPMRLALIPVGYADGLRRSLSSRDGRTGGWVMIHNRRAPIVGRVSMNLTTVDVTGIGSMPKAGDDVILLGDGVSAEDHGRLADCLPYEILCGLRGVPVSA